MEKIFVAELSLIKSELAKRDYNLDVPKFALNNIYLPGVLGTHAGMPEVYPYLSLEHIIKGPVANLEIELRGNLPISEIQKKSGKSKYSTDGIKEKIDAAYKENGFVPLASYLKGELLLSKPYLFVAAELGNPHVQFWLELENNQSSTKVSSPYKAFKDEHFQYSLRLVLDLFTGKKTWEDFMKIEQRNRQTENV